MVERLIAAGHDPAQGEQMELTVLAGLIASVELPGKLVLRVLGALAPGWCWWP